MTPHKPSDRDAELARALGRNLQRARERKGLSQEDLMAVSGVHKTSISTFERAAVEPKLATLLVLCVALEIEVGEMLAGIRWNPGPDTHWRKRSEGRWEVSEAERRDDLQPPARPTPARRAPIPVRCS